MVLSYEGALSKSLPLVPKGGGARAAATEGLTPLSRLTLTAFHNSQWSFRIFAPPCADACAVFRVFAPLSPSAARCSGAADALWACPRASSRFAAFDCALRFASCARHFSPSGLRCSQVRLRLSLLHWGLRTGLRFAGPVFRGCGRPLGVSSPLHPFGASTGLLSRCFAHSARFVRPPWERGAFWIVVLSHEGALSKSLP